MIDLHAHSTFSDGSETPASLVRLAKEGRVRALALTDHDNVDGAGEFLDACRAARLTGIAGIEWSADVETGTLHILGLGLDPACKSLLDACNDVLDSRDERNHRILAKLNELGFGLTWDEVQELAGEDVIGRPHFARAMIARGWAETTGEVFERYLEKGAPAYFDRFRLEPKEAIAVIREAGGVAVIAHPTSWSDDFPDLKEKIGELVEDGLQGIEAYYSSHSPETTLELLRLAKHFGLLVTGGSDFHGEDVKPGIRIGVGNGSLHVPDKLLPPLLAEMNPAGFVKAED